MESQFELFRERGAGLDPEQFRALGAEALWRVLQEDPRMEAYIQYDNVAIASSAMKSLGQFLHEYPWLLPKLQKMRPTNSGSVLMIVAPNERLVFAKTHQAAVVMAPALGCSLQALADIQYQMDSTAKLALVESEHTVIGLLEGVAQIAEDPTAILSYRGSGLSSGDYLALGILGVFKNEIFRRRIDIE